MSGIFSDEPFTAALARAAAEGRWLIVDVVDRAKPASWAMTYTTWRDADLGAWVEANAIAVQVDACADAEATRALRVEAGEAPAVILLRDGKERRRLFGRTSAADLLQQLERAEVAEENLRIARAMLKDPERDMMGRDGYAGALLQAGLLEDSLREYEWLWLHATEADPEFAGVRVSFMASEIEKLCREYQPARGRFAELRDQAAVAAFAASDAHARIQCWHDYLVLNKALDDEARTIAWLDALDGADRRALPSRLVDLWLVPPLVARERWDEVGALVRDPLEWLERALSHAKLMGEAPHREVGAFYRGLLAAGRAADADAVKREALLAYDTPAMRAALR